jgi:hypothetical protein
MVKSKERPSPTSPDNPCRLDCHSTPLRTRGEKRARRPSRFFLSAHTSLEDRDSSFHHSQLATALFTTQHAPEHLTLQTFNQVTLQQRFERLLSADSLASSLTLVLALSPAYEDWSSTWDFAPGVLHVCLCFSD